MWDNNIARRLYEALLHRPSPDTDLARVKAVAEYRDGNIMLPTRPCVTKRSHKKSK